MANLKQMLEQQQKLQDAIAKEKKMSHIRAGKALEKLYKSDPALKDISKVLGICAENFPHITESAKQP